MVASGWDGVQTLLGKIWTRLEAVDKLADGQETISKRLDSLEAKMNDFHARHMPKEITSPGRAKVEVSSARAPVQAPKPQTESLPGRENGGHGNDLYAGSRQYGSDENIMGNLQQGKTSVWRWPHTRDCSQTRRRYFVREHLGQSTNVRCEFLGTCG